MCQLGHLTRLCRQDFYGSYIPFFSSFNASLFTPMCMMVASSTFVKPFGGGQENSPSHHLYISITHQPRHCKDHQPCNGRRLVYKMGRTYFYLLEPKRTGSHQVLKPLPALRSMSLSETLQQGSYVAHFGSIWEKMTYTEKYVTPFLKFQAALEMASFFPRM